MWGPPSAPSGQLPSRGEHWVDGEDVSAWKRIPFHVDRDPAKPGRTQNWFELAALEKAVGRKITWVYSNLIEPGKTAGSHYHKEHEVLVPADVYHAGGNVSEKDCLVVMFATTRPRDGKDEYFL